MNLVFVCVSHRLSCVDLQLLIEVSSLSLYPVFYPNLLRAPVIPDKCNTSCSMERLRVSIFFLTRPFWRGNAAHTHFIFDFHWHACSFQDGNRSGLKASPDRRIKDVTTLLNIPNIVVECMSTSIKLCFSICIYFIYFSFLFFGKAVRFDRWVHKACCVSFSFFFYLYPAR